MKKTNLFRWASLALVCQMTLTACQQETLNQQASQGQTTKPKTGKVSGLAKKDQDKINDQSAQTVDDSSQEGLVTAIFADGYQLVEGDKMSLVKGKVPYEAKFSSSTLPPEGYTFKDKDVLYEVEKGYIITHDGQFYYYPKTKGANLVQAAIPGVTVPTSDGFILTKQSKITAATKEGIVVDHDGHSHFIFYSDLKGTEFAHLIPSGAQLTARPTARSSQQVAASSSKDDGHHYVFNPADIVAEDALGYTVRHDDHYHYILKSSLGIAPSGTTFGNGGATMAAPSSQGLPVGQAGGAQIPSAPLNPRVTLSPATGVQTTSSPASRLGIAGIDYPTSDGFLFDGSGMRGWTDLGLLVDHGGHLHLVLTQDLLNSSWAHLVPGHQAVPTNSAQPSSSSPVNPPTPSQTTSSTGNSTQTSRPAVAETSPSSQDQTMASSTVQAPTDQAGDQPAPTADDKPVATDEQVKRDYLSKELGLSPDRLVLIDTPNGPAFIYPHDDHHHVVLLSDLDISKPYDDGHGEHDHHNQATSQSEVPAEPAPTATSEDTGHEPEMVTEPTTSTESEPAPVAEEVTPAEDAVGDQPVSEPEIGRIPEVAPTADDKPVATDEQVKRDYLSKELGLSPDRLVLIDTPNGPAFIYPHDDHHHVVLLSQLDLTKPYDDGHGDDKAPTAQPEVSAPAEPTVSIPSVREETAEPTVTSSSDDTTNKPTTSTESEPAPVAEEETPAEETSVDQPVSEPEVGRVPEVAPTADDKPVATDEQVKRDYLSKELGLSPDRLVLIDTPTGPAFIYPHGDHHHVVLLSQLDLTKPYDDGHDDHGHDHDHDHGHEESTTPVVSESPSASVVAEVPASPAPSQPAQSIPEEPSVVEPPVAGPAPTEPVSEPAAPVEEAPVAAPEISRIPELAPTADEKPLADDELVKRTYLAKELGISPDSLVLIELADGKAFIYPHDTHHHVVSLGDLDITKPFDTGHGHHDHEAEKPAEATKQPAVDAPNSEETSPAREEEIPSETTTEEATLAEEAVEAPASVPASEGDQASSQPEGVTSTNSAETEHQATSATKLTEEDKRDLTAYIRKTYGLLLGTPVTFHDDFVVFAIPHPHQDYDAKRDYYSDELDPAYDPGHVHPYAVPLAHLDVLKPTGNPELDFENELIAAAKRIGVSPSEVKIKDKKYFVLPGHDHDHYLNILTPREGYDAYMANKLPDIKPSFATGAFDKSAVTAEVDRIRAAAKDKYGEDSLDYRRLARVLEEFTTNLRTATTSTDAYVAALQSFENKHLKGLETSPEATSQEVNPYVARYTALTDQLKAYDERTIKAYGLNPDQLLNRLKAYTAAQDDAGLASVETHFAAINRAKKASSDLAPRLAYMDYFVRNLDSDKLPASLRQEVIAKLTELQKISGLNRNHQKFREGLADTALLKEKVQKALAVDGPAPDHANWEPYPRGFDRREIVRGINAMRDFVIRHNEIMPDELAAGFDKPLELFPVHPKKPSQPVADPAQPKPVEQPVAPEKDRADGSAQPATDKAEPSPSTGSPAKPAAPEKEEKPADSPESTTPPTDKTQAADTARPSAEAPATDADSADQGTSAGQPETSRDETDSESGAAPSNQADGAIETEGPVQPDAATPSLDEEEENVDPFEDFTTEELERLLEALNKRDQERQGESSAETAFDEFSPEELEKINAAINRLTEGNQSEVSDETSAGTASPEAPADQDDRQPVGKETGSEEVSAPATEHDNHSSSTDETNRPAEEEGSESSTSSESAPEPAQPTESATDEGTSATASPEPAASDVSSDEPVATEEEPAPAPVEEATLSPVLTDGPGEEEEDDWPALTWGGSIFNILDSDGNDFDDWERPIDRPSRWSDDELPTWGGSIFNIPGGNTGFFDEP